VSHSLLHDAFAHHIWATDRLLEICADLTDEQLATSAPGTHGSIIGTLRHLVASEGWYQSFFPVEHTSINEKAETSVAELRSAFGRMGSAWLALLERDLGADEEIVEQDGGWTVRSPVGVRLAQVPHHGTDHRSQVCTILTTLGVTPPDIDVWAYARATGRERAEKSAGS